MPFMHKLSRRLAQSRDIVGVVGLCALLGGCQQLLDLVQQSTVVAITVEPETLTVDPAQTIDYHAYGRTAAGDVISDVPISWTAAGGTITDGGVYTAGSVAGDYLVTATSAALQLSNTARVRIRDVAPPPETTDCSATVTGRIWCDDFDVDRLSSYYEYASANGKFSRVAGAGRDGTYGMRAQWAAGDVNAGALHLAFGKTPSSYWDPVDDGTALYRDLYWRFYFKNQSGWVPSGENEKTSRALIFAGTNFENAAFAHLWSGDGSSAEYLILDPASGTDEEGNLKTTKYNDFDNMRWLGIARGTTPVLGTAASGVWHCVEVHALLNDADQANGVFEFWIDGVLEARKADLNWVGNYSTYAWNAVFLENYINAGAPQAQERVFDDFIVSTQRIGC